MALCNQDWDIINRNLFVEGAKFWRSGYFNRKTGEEQNICSEYRRTKSPCSAMVRYVPRGEPDSDPALSSVCADAENDEGDGAEDDELLPDDARLQSDKYDIVLVYATPVELHAEFHEIDLMNAKVEEMKEKMAEIMMRDPTLEPATIVDKVLNDFTDNLDGNAKSELISKQIFGYNICI